MASRERCCMYGEGGGSLGTRCRCRAQPEFMHDHASRTSTSGSATSQSGSRSDSPTPATPWSLSRACPSFRTCTQDSMNQSGTRTSLIRYEIGAHGWRSFLRRLQGLQAHRLRTSFASGAEEVHRTFKLYINLNASFMSQDWRVARFRAVSFSTSVKKTTQATVGHRFPTRTSSSRRRKRDRRNVGAPRINNCRTKTGH